MDGRRRVSAMLVTAAIVTLGSWAPAQPPPAPAQPAPSPAAASPAGASAAANPPAAASPAGARTGGGKSSAASAGPGSPTATLPNGHGQVWRRYDIRSYTSRLAGVEKPERAVIDWILRETGTELWFAEPLGLLSANATTVSVYHTPEVQAVVSATIDRFVQETTEPYVLGLRLATVNSPNWRSQAIGLLQPVQVQSPGVEAWLLSKENAAVLLANLRKRTDYREHNSPRLEIHNGQTQRLERRQPRTFARRLRRRPGPVPLYDVEPESLSEGYSLEISPLISARERTIDAVLRCHVDQVEKLVQVPVDLPGFGGGPQRVQLQVPQLVSWRLHERFRWPQDRVLLLSCGVVATPGRDAGTILGLPNPFPATLPGSGGRADALLFVEVKGRASQTLPEAPAATARGTGLLPLR